MAGAYVSSRGRRTAVVSASLVALLVPLVLFMWLRSTDLYDGSFTSTAQWSNSGVEVGEPTGPSLLRPGDVVIAADAIPLTGRGAQILPPAQLQPGATVTYSVHRHGGTPLQVRVRLTRYPIRQVVSGQPGALLCLACVDGVALLVMAYRPRVPAARLLLLLGVLLPLTGWQWPAGLQVVDVVTGHLAPYVVSEVAATLVWAVLACFTLVFPRPVSLLDRRPAWFVAVFGLPFALYGVQVLVSQLSGGSPRGQVAAAIAISTPSARVFPAMIIGALVVRYHLERSPAQRRRLRWVLASFTGALAVYVSLGVLPSAVLGHWLLPSAWLAGAFAVVPLAVGAGILRYRLLDIEVVLSRSLVYLGLTVAAFTAYAAATFGLGRLVGHGVALVGASGAVALVVLALRDRWVRTVTRLLYGDRDNPYRLLDQLSHLDPGRPPHAVLTEITATVAAALRLPYVSLEVTMPSGHQETVAVGSPSGAGTTAVPLSFHGEQLGRLLLATSPGREPFGDGDDQLLIDLGWHVATAVHAVRVSLALQRSRQQLVNTREEERRRIRRDLHDGLGPSLAAAAMQLEVARELVDDDPTAARAVISQVQTAAQAALTDIRRLVDDLRPPALDQLGLVSALRERAGYFAGQPRNAHTAGGSLTVTVTGTGNFEALPAAVEVAAYRIGIEAVTNSARHSNATRCDVLLDRTPGQLTVTVTDDGHGIPQPVTIHVGLSSMRERAEELGGNFTAGPHPEGGTVVCAHLPLPEPGMIT